MVRSTGSLMVCMYRYQKEDDGIGTEDTRVLFYFLERSGVISAVDVLFFGLTWCCEFSILRKEVLVV